jgi:hypothetical protein
MSDDTRPCLRLVSWKPLNKGALRVFGTVELPIGLKLIDCPVFVGRRCPPSAVDMHEAERNSVLSRSSSGGLRRAPPALRQLAPTAAQVR